MSDQEVHKALVQARRHIEIFGWTKGEWGSNNIYGPACLVGSIEAGLGMAPSTIVRTFVPNPVVTKAIYALGFNSVRAATHWNDRSRRTVRKVLKRLDKAILATAPPIEMKPQLESSHEFELE